MRGSDIGRVCDDLKKLGVRSGGVLLVHASFKSLGRVGGGAETVIRALLEALGGDGTLLMPALSYATVNAANPVFDQLNTPSCVGYLPEYFRTRPGTLRSLHPTHSVCGVGRSAGELLGRHEMDHTPCGPNSPFRKLRDREGQLLMLGCGLHPNTSMHAVEELSQPPYLLGNEVVYTMIPAGRPSFEMRVLRHKFLFRGTRYAQRYDRLGPLLDGAKGEVRTGRVLQAVCQLIEVRAMWEKGHWALRHNPFFFVERV
ncbi:MAG: AAC(3) family N-acetyltransferase [Kiritimatiellaeota bacterium]|nr:AAC(3) family N-acetyltransferase [Kiritimatiellota bacterium]